LELETQLPVERLAELQKAVKAIHLSEACVDYCYDLVAFSRNCGRFQHGLSPRAGLGLLQAARAWSLLNGRDFVLPEDIQAVAPACLSHRLISGDDNAPVGHNEVGDYLLRSVPVP